MKVRWLGHSAFQITGNDVVLVDPFIEGNPSAKVKVNELKCDIIAVTHGHGDHLGDTATIARNNDATVACIYEIANYLCNLPGKQIKTEAMNIGGSVRIKSTRLTMTQAHHSSSIEGKYAGAPAGFVIDSGKRVYHAGDTGLFSDMKLIGEIYKPEVVLLPIGDKFTMNMSDAALATSWLKPEVVIPMHYNTWPQIEQRTSEFVELVNSLCDTEVVVLEPGETYEF
ncbi:MAG: metal-dependent hydrolase [Thermoplasmata archaeon]